MASTRRRLTLALVGVVALGFAVLIPWQMRDLRPRYLTAMEETMVDAANLLAISASQAVEAGRLDPARLHVMFPPANRLLTARIYEIDKRTIDAWIGVTDERGIVLVDGRDPALVGSESAAWRNIARTLRGAYGARTTWEQRGDRSEEVLHVSAPILHEGRLVGVLTVSKPAGSIALVVDQARRAALVAVGAVALAMLVLGLLVTWWLTRPIARLTEHVRELQAGRRTPIPHLGASDLVALGAAFESMRDAIDGRAYIERYVQTLTHEMKSPLAALRAAAELLSEELPEADRRRFLANLRSEVDRLHDLIVRLLQLAALERRRTLEQVEDIDLFAVVGEVVDSFAATMQARGLRCGAPTGAGALVRGERFLIRQALANLLQNACDFSPVGAVIVVAVERRDGCWTVIIDDSGPGLPAFAEQRVFERFFSLPRPDGARKGTGLGLPLVQEVALLHGGRAGLTNRPAGGVRATLELPAI